MIFLILLGSALGSEQTLHVTETDLVKLQIEGKDVDGDTLTYTYSSPLDSKGEWETNYGDAGEYNIKVTASDGQAQTTSYILLIVDKKNQAPVLTQRKITLSEGEIVHLQNIVRDPDGDSLTYTFKEPFDQKGEWKTSSNDEGVFSTEFNVTDGKITVALKVEMEVLHTNQPPQIVKTFSEKTGVEYPEDEEVQFSVEVKDDDDDPLTYQWVLDNKTIGTERVLSHYFNYSTEGTYSLIFNVSDGRETAAKNWNLKIKKKNRSPKIEHVPIIVNEGENVKLVLPKTDEDGDQVSYMYNPPLNRGGEWQTNFNDAGSFHLKINATDGNLTTSGVVDVTVLDVDRSPTGTTLTEEVVFEGEHWFLPLNFSDPDGDKVLLSVDGLSDGMILKNNTLTWNPSYDLIKRKGGTISDILNTLRLEHFFLTEKTYPLVVKACGKKECLSQDLLIHLRHVNRAPVFDLVNKTKVMETEKVSLMLQAVDPDGDIVHYYYTEPLSKYDASWETKKGDKGNYTTYVTATDGKNENTIAVPIIITKKNILPTIKTEDTLKVNENQEFTLSVKASDEDNDPLTLKLRNPPTGASFKEGVLVWQPGYGSVINKTDSWWNSLVGQLLYTNKQFNSEKAAVWLEFVASDGEAEVVHPVRVDIVNVNRAPQIIDYLPEKVITATIGKPVVFHVTGKDLDGDVLTYAWSFSFHEPRVMGTDTVERTFVSVGEKEVVVAVSDGRKTVSQKWTVNVVDDGRDVVGGEPQKNVPFTARVYELEFGN